MNDTTSMARGGIRDPDAYYAKHCSYCDMHGHLEHHCYRKYPHLRPSATAVNMDLTQEQRNSPTGRTTTPPTVPVSSVLIVGECTFQDLGQINRINHEKQQQRQVRKLRKLLGLAVAHTNLEEMRNQVLLEIVNLHINLEGQPLRVDQLIQFAKFQTNMVWFLLLYSLWYRRRVSPR